MWFPFFIRNILSSSFLMAHYKTLFFSSTLSPPHHPFLNSYLSIRSSFIIPSLLQLLNFYKSSIYGYNEMYGTYLLRDGSGRDSSSVTSRFLRRVLQTFTGSVSVMSCPGLGIGVEADVEIEVEVGRCWSSGSCPSVSRVRHSPVKNTFTFLVPPFTLVTSVDLIYRLYECKHSIRIEITSQHS